MLDRPLSFSPNRRWKIGANVAASVAAVALILVLLNFISAKHFARIQWSSTGHSALSPVTKELLHSITNRVKVVVFFDRTKPLYDMVSDLLGQYSAESGRLEVEYVDYERSPRRAKVIEGEYGTASDQEMDRIIFDSGSKRQVVYARDLSEYDYQALLRGEKEVKRTGFKGEQLFTSAIYTLADNRSAKIYFLSGHREHDPTSSDGQSGYLKFAKVLSENQTPIERLGPTELLAHDVPGDCQLLIAANPLDALTPQEVQRIEKYLNLGGRMLILFSDKTVFQNTGLEQMLEDHWNVTVGRDFVYDSQSSASAQEPVIVTHFAAHPIVASLGDSRLLLIAPRSVGAATKNSQGADVPKVAELATTGPDGVASLGSGRIARQGAKIPLMVAVEKGAIQGMTAARGTTRIVVVGDSYFLANSAIEFDGNREFARNAVNWLLSRDILVRGIGTQPIKEYRITMSSTELSTIRWVLEAGIPGSVLVLGFLVWVRRRA
jgi:hypothetical protein